MERSITEIAHDLVHGDRRAVYGHPLDDYIRVAGLWSAYLGMDITPQQAGVMMILLKCGRLKHTPDHRDSLIDIAGYAECVDLMNTEEKRRASSTTE